MKLFKFKDPNTGGTRYCDKHGKLYGTDRSITRRRNKRFSEKKEEGYTNKQKTIEDLKKAVWYLNDEINMLQKEN